MYYMLLYDVVEDYVEKRAAFREEHLGLAHEFEMKGQLILGGAFANPVDGAALVFKADGIRQVEDFARKDPYVKHGLVKSWKVREWTVVIGAES